MAAIQEDLVVETETKHKATTDDATNTANTRANITSNDGEDTKQDRAGSEVKLYSGIYEEVILVPLLRRTTLYS